MQRAIVILMLHLTFCVHAQVQEQLSPTEKKYQSEVTEPLTLYKGFFRGAFATSFSATDKLFDEDGKRVMIPSNLGGSDQSILPSIEYGITDRLELELVFAYRNSNSSQLVVYEIPEIDSVIELKSSVKRRGIGDTDITLGYQLIPGSYTKPFLGLLMTLTVPTGEKNYTHVTEEKLNEYHDPTGTGEFSLTPQLKYRKINYPYSYNFFTGYTAYFGCERLLNPHDSVERPFQTGNSFNVAASFNIHLNNWIILKAFADYTWRDGDLADGEKGENSWQLLCYPGLSFQMKRFRLAQALTFPIVGKSSPASISYVVSFQCMF